MDKWLISGVTNKQNSEVCVPSTSKAFSNNNKQSEVCGPGVSKETRAENSEVNLSTASEGNSMDITKVSKNTPLSMSKRKNQSSTSAVTKKRKYFDEYLKYGFYFSGDEDSPRPQCVVCSELLANSSMKPSMLARHLLTKHPNYKEKDRSFFERLLKQKNVLSYFGSSNKDNENAVEASYKISYHIAKSGKSHTIAEKLIVPCIKDAVSCMLGEEHIKKINTIPLSNSTISRRIKDMANDIEETVVTRIKNSKNFAIQVDESTDVTKCAVLLVIARYLYENEPEENLLLCYPLPETTTGADIFDVINGYFIQNEISWKNCCGLSTDGAKSMSGCFIGLRALVKEVAPHVTWTHCCIHRQSLACKNLPTDLKLVLDDAVKIVNFIKKQALNSRIFKCLCEEMDSLHLNLLYHTEVRWLSRGKVLSRLFELRNEVQLFFEGTTFQHSSKLHDSNWLQCLAYLSDIFLQINKLNLSLQVSAITVFKVSEKIESMTKKIDFWMSCIMKGQTEIFDTLDEFLKENELQISHDVQVAICEHLKGLKSSFEKYFPKQEESIQWIKDPFCNEYFQSAQLNVTEKENLIDISTHSSLKQDFKRKPLIKFWLDLHNEYENLSNLAIKVLLPFPTTELVERSFSSYAYIKNKYRNKLDAAPDIRVYLASFEPNFKKLCDLKQAQGSH